MGLPLSYSRWDFQTNWYRPHPQRGLKLLSEPCFCHLKSFELSTWLASFPDFFIHLRLYSAIGKQLLFSNNRNRVRWAVLDLSQGEHKTDLFENFSVKGLKRDLSNNITVNPPLFALVNTFKVHILNIYFWGLKVCDTLLQFYIKEGVSDAALYYMLAPIRIQIIERSMSSGLDPKSIIR